MLGNLLGFKMDGCRSQVLECINTNDIKKTIVYIQADEIIETLISQKT
mgnify:CR=1 FL=1